MCCDLGPVRGGGGAGRWQAHGTPRAPNVRGCGRKLDDVWIPDGLRFPAQNTPCSNRLLRVVISSHPAHGILSQQPENVQAKRNKNVLKQNQAIEIASEMISRRLAIDF